MSFASDFEKKKTKKSRTSKMVEDTLEAAAVQKSISEAKQNEEIAKRDAEIAKDLGLAGRDMSDILNPNNFKSNPNYMTQAELEERRKKDKTVDKTLTYGGKEIGKVSEAAYRTLQYGNIDTYVPVNDEEKATLEKLKNSSGGKNKVKKIEDYIPKIGETKEQYEARRAADSSLPEFGTKEYFIAKVGEVGDLLDAAERSVADHKQIDPKDLAKLRETDPERVRKIDEDISYHRSLAEEYAILVENLKKFEPYSEEVTDSKEAKLKLAEAKAEDESAERLMKSFGTMRVFDKDLDTTESDKKAYRENYEIGKKADAKVARAQNAVNELEYKEEFEEVCARNGLNANTFNYDDLSKWAHEHNYEYRANAGAGDFYPKYKDGKKLTSKQEEEDFRILKEYATLKTYADSAKKYPTAMSLISISGAPGRGVAGALAAAKDAATLAGYGDDKKSSVGKGRLYMPAKTTGAIRKTVDKEYAQKWFGGAEGKIGNYGSLLYNGLMSIGDNVVNTLTVGSLTKGVGNASGAAKFASGLTSALMASDATATAIVENKEKGMSDGKAVALGVAQGIGEYITEKLALDGVFDRALDTASVPKLIKAGFADFASESFEEVASNNLTRAADLIINQSEAEIIRTYERYLNNGMSKAEAFKATAESILYEDLSAGLVGGFSGVAMGGAYKSVNDARIRSLGGDIKKGVIKNISVEKVVNDGLLYSEKSEIQRRAEKINKKMKDGKSVSSYEIGKLFADIASDRKKNVSEAEKTYEVSAMGDVAIVTSGDGEVVRIVEDLHKAAEDMFMENPDIPDSDKAKAVEIATEITNLAADNVKKATNRDVNVPSLLNFSSGFVNDKDVSIDYNLMHSFAEVMAGCIDVNSTIAKNISASGRTIAGALTEYVLYGTGGDYIKSAQFRGAALSFADTFGKTVQALVGERTALYGQDSVLTAQAEALAKGDYSFMISGETQGVENAENNDIINDRYVVRDAVASAMGDTLAPDALGRIAAGFSDENGNADLGAFIDSMVNHYAENGNMGEYASLFTDGGASVAEVINRTRSEINEKIQHSGSVQGRSVRDSENLGRRAGEYTPEPGERIQRGTGRTEETAYAGRTTEQEVGGVRYNEISRDDWSAEMEQLAQENSDKYGVETVYFAGEAVNEAGDKADAFYYDGVLYLQIDGEHDIRTLRDHEVTHHQEGSEAHGVFKESVKKKLGKEKYDELFRRYMDKYRKTLAKVIEKAQKESGGTLTDDELNQIARDYIDDEILANINAGTNEYAELCAEEVATFRNAIENKTEAKEGATTDTSGKVNDKPGEYKTETDAGPKFDIADDSVSNQIRISDKSKLTENDMEEYMRAGTRKNKSKAKALADGKKIFLVTEEEIVSFIHSSISDAESLNTVGYGRVNERLSRDVSMYSDGEIKIEGNFLELVPYDINHAYSEHLDAKEDGDIDLTIEDFENIPQYIEHYDELVYAIRFKSGNTRICLSKKLPYGRVLIIEAVSKSRGSILFKNMIGVSEEKYIKEYKNKYKKRSNSNSRGSISSNISLHDKTASDNSILDFGEKVNKNFSNADSIKPKLNLTSSEPYSTQKIIEAKALATDDSELIEAAKENTKQVQRYVRMNSDLQKRLENAKRQMTKSKAPQVNKFEAAKVVKEIIADLEGTVKAADLKDEITDIYNSYYSDIKKAGRVEGKVQEANDRLAERLNVVATKIITSAETTVEHEGYALLKEWLKETAIKVPDDAKAEAEYSAVRKANFGTLNLTNDGLPIDIAYQELCELYPEWFSDKVTAPADQLKKIVEVLNSVKPDVYNPYAQDMAGGIEYAVYRLVSALDGISVMPDTKADKAAKKAASDKAKAVEKARKTFEDKMSKQKEKSDAQIAKLREQLSAAKYVRYWEQRLSNEERVQSIKEIREKRKIATLKARIRKIVSELNRGLDKTEKAGGYPKELVSAVAEVCAAVDFHTGRPGKGGGESKASIKLNELKAKYEELKSGVYEEYRDEYSEELNDHINKLIKSVGGKRVNELTLEELENLKTILSEIKHRLVTAKKQIGIDKAIANADIGREVMSDWAKNDDLISAEKNRLAKAFRSGTARAKAFLFNPHRINEMLAGYDENSAWWSVYDQLRRGARKAAKFTMDATKPFDELTSGNGGNEIAYYNFRTELIDSGITDTKGNRVKLTKAIMCELVMAWERGQGRKHLENGGFKIPDIKMYNKGKTTVAMNEGATRTRPVTQADITRIKGMLDSYDLEWIAAAKNLFDNVSKKAINETSMQLLGREVAKEKNYIRLHTDTDFVKTDIDGLKVDATLEGAGSLKSVVENAMQPIILRGLSDNVYEQIDFVAKYSGLAIPIRNFSKVYNVSTMDKFGNRESVKETLGKKFGSKIQKDVVEGMVRELQSPRDKNYSAFDGVRGKWLTATFWGNVRSMLKQTTSYCTASSILSESSLVKGLAVYAKVGNRLTSEEVSKHTGSLYKREQGLSTTELGERAERKRVVTDSMFAKAVNKFAPWLKKIPEGLRPGNWLQAMDCTVASALWQACKIEVSDVMGISEGSEGYFEAVTDLYDKVIEETQSNYDLLHRPEALKRTDSLTQVVTMFQTDNLQQTGIIYGAFGDYRAKADKYKAETTKENETAYKDAKKRLAKAVRSRVYSAVWLAAVTVAGDLLLRKYKSYRDEEENDITASSVANRVLMNVAEDMFGVFIPIVCGLLMKGVGAFSNGYDFLTEPAFDSMQNFIETSAGLVKACLSDGDDKEEKVKKALDKFLAAAGTFTGIPYKNVTDWYKAVEGYIGDIKEGDFAHDIEDYAPTKSLFSYGDLASSITRGDSKQEKRITDYYSKYGKTINKGSLTKEIKPAYVEMLVDEPEKAGELRKKLVRDYGYKVDVVDEWAYDILAKKIVGGDVESQDEIKSAIGRYNEDKLFSAIKDDYVDLVLDDAEAASAVAEVLKDKYGLDEGTLGEWNQAAEEEKIGTENAGNLNNTEGFVDGELVSEYSYDELADSILGGDDEYEGEVNKSFEAYGKEFNKSSLTKEIKADYVEMLVDEPEKAANIKQKLVDNYGYDGDTVDGWVYTFMGDAVIDGDAERISRYRGVINGYKPSKLASAVRSDWIDLAKADMNAADELAYKLMNEYGVEKKTIDKWYKTVNGE